MQKENNNPCAFFETEVWLYISNELSPDRKKVWDAHLEICSECRALLNGNREFAGMYKENMEEDILDSSLDCIIAAAVKEKSLLKKGTESLKDFGGSFSLGKIAFGTTIAAVSVIALLVTRTPEMQQAQNQIKAPDQVQVQLPNGAQQVKIVKWDDAEQRSKIEEIQSAISHLKGDTKISDVEWSKSIKGIESRIDSLKFCINN